MSEITFAARSVLADAVTPGHHGATGQTDAALTVLPGLTLAMLTARKGSASSLHAAIARDFGIDLPTTPGRCVKDGLAFVWSGPGRWLAIGAPQDGLPARLASSAGTYGDVTDVGGSRVTVRVSGSRARDGLMKLIPIDLGESAFAAGSAALTVAAHIPVQLWQFDELPTYDIVCPRSYGISLLEALIAAFIEYGCDVRV